jgi:uncharacterized protein
MSLSTDSALLRIFIGESDHLDHKPLYEVLVLKARAYHLAGATVLRGPMGFGKTSTLHTSKILQLSMDLPIIVEIVDSEEKLLAFLDTIKTILSGCLVTIEKVRVLRYDAEDRR